MRRESAQAIDHRLRLEHAVGVRQQGKRLAVESNAELLVERAGLRLE